MKEFLEDKGVQLSRFKQFRVNKAAARRSLKRLQGGEISVPTQPTNNQIRETLMVSLGTANANQSDQNNMKDHLSLSMKRIPTLLSLYFYAQQN